MGQSRSSELTRSGPYSPENAGQTVGWGRGRGIRIPGRLYRKWVNGVIMMAPVDRGSCKCCARDPHEHEFLGVPKAERDCIRKGRRPRRHLGCPGWRATSSARHVKGIAGARRGLPKDLRLFRYRYRCLGLFGVHECTADVTSRLSPGIGPERWIGCQGRTPILTDACGGGKDLFAVPVFENPGQDLLWEIIDGGVCS